MKNIKVMKKEYILIEKKELLNVLTDLNLFAIMVNGDAQRAKVTNGNFVTGLCIDNIIEMSESTTNYISKLKFELI